MVEAKEVRAGGEQGRNTASRATQLPPAPHPQQPPPIGSLLSLQEAKQGLQSHGQEGWVLGDTHGITGEASPRLSAPSALPALDLGSLHPAGYHHFASSQHPGVVVSLQLASSSTGGGRRTGWTVWEGHFSLACRFPVSKLSLQGPGCCTCGQHCRVAGGSGRWAPPGHWRLATSPWAARPWAEGMEAPGAGLSASHVGSAGGCQGAMGGEGFPPQLAAPSRGVETSEWRHQSGRGCTVSSSMTAASPAPKPRIVPWVPSTNCFQT